MSTFTLASTFCYKLTKQFFAMDYFLCSRTWCASDVHAWFGSVHCYEYSTKCEYCFEFELKTHGDNYDVIYLHCHFRNYKSGICYNALNASVCRRLSVDTAHAATTLDGCEHMSMHQSTLLEFNSLDVSQTMHRTAVTLTALILDTQDSDCWTPSSVAPLFVGLGR